MRLVSQRGFQVFSDDLADVVAAHPVFEHHAPGAMVIIETRWILVATDYNHQKQLI